MAKEQHLEVDGIVINAIVINAIVINAIVINAMFKVKLENQCIVTGKIRMNCIKILPGDKVRLQMSYLSKARII